MGKPADVILYFEPLRRTRSWPTEGRILLDGVDLREYDIESLRRKVGVIFQDFVRYDFMLRENIAVGNIGRLGDERAHRGAGCAGGVRSIPEVQRVY